MSEPKRSEDAPKQPEHESDGQGTDQTVDRSQAELTEENLLLEQRDEADDPEKREKLEGELGEMEDELEDANEE